MALLEIALVIIGGLLVFLVGRFAQEQNLGRSCAAWGCGVYFFLVICIVPFALFGTMQTRHDADMFGNDEWYGWVFFWVVMAGIGYFVGQYLPDSLFAGFGGAGIARRRVIRRVSGMSNTKDVIGPLQLDAGLYLLGYELKGRARSFPAMTVTIQNMSADDYFEQDTAPPKQPLVLNISTGEKRAGQPSGPGVCIGTEPLQLDAGHYLFEFAFKAVQEWNIVISKADLRKG